MSHRFQFPHGFFWGAATSAHQVEGGNHNDWSEWEKSPKRIAELKARGLNPDDFVSGVACDHYRRYEDDFDIAKSLEHNAHRFSIEWSRIEPEEGKFNNKEIEHYQKVVIAIRGRGMEPFVTLWHWTLPLWLRDKGGVLAVDFPEKFERYVAFVVEKFPEVRMWMTLNEPTSVIANSYFLGVWPPHKKGFLPSIRAFWKLAEAHNLAYQRIHSIRSNVEVGVGNVLKYQEPFRRDPLTLILIKINDFFTNRYFYRLTRNSHDWLGVQYYFHEKLRFSWRKFKTLFLQVDNDNLKLSDMRWEIYPEGIYHVLKFADSFRKPIYITENGVADAKDQYRADFIQSHLQFVARAISEGVDVRGYFHWSLLDNFEWDKGFEPRFGLVEVNYKTQERKIRPSALEYKKIISLNSIEI